MRVSCPRCALATHPRYSPIQVRPHQWQRALPYVSAVDHAVLLCIVLHFPHVALHCACLVDGWTACPRSSRSRGARHASSTLCNTGDHHGAHTAQSHTHSHGLPPSWRAFASAVCQACGQAKQNVTLNTVTHRAAHSCTAWWTACRCASCRVHADQARVEIMTCTSERLIASLLAGCPLYMPS
jgi:hypothetical protein